MRRPPKGVPGPRMQLCTRVHDSMAHQGAESLTITLQRLPCTARYPIWCAEGSFPTWGLLGKAFVTAYHRAWKATHGLLAKSRIPESEHLTDQKRNVAAVSQARWNTLWDWGRSEHTEETRADGRIKLKEERIHAALQRPLTYMTSTVLAGQRVNN